MRSELEKIKSDLTRLVSQVENASQVEELRIQFLGKKGRLTAVLRGLSGVSDAERPALGQFANSIRRDLESQLENLKSDFETKQRLAAFVSEKIDVTLPGRRKPLGARHPLAKVTEEFCRIFGDMGFSVVEGPEIEHQYYNFEALNIPENHPARDEQDTFYINDDLVLRTQTSPVQIRVMESSKPPIRIIAPGRVYRSDSVDASHSPMFHQVEGLVVDKGIRMSDLKGTLTGFIRRFYDKDTEVRFRPHNFQFTEPSAEMDMACPACNKKGCSLCKNEGFVEILGAGMVHPKVLERCGIDSSVYSGFAFGIGLERIALRLYQMNDLRLFFENDVRMIKQF